MKHKQFWAGTAASLGMLVLIIDSKTALEGSQIGVDLCLKTVIPSLFPFFLLSNLLIKGLTGSSLPVLQPLGRLCRIPDGAEVILLSGFLGGYPVGAQCISESYQSGQLQKDDAERMLSFCNNAGPAFLFGMISQFFPEKKFVWLLWLVHILSAILVSVFLPANGRRSLKATNVSEISLPASLQSAIRVMAAVCGWVILFRVLISFLERWFLWLFPVEYRVLLTGLLELSNGCCELDSVASLSTRFLICSGMLAFGGSCVWLQTASVTKGLSLNLYIKGKLMQTLFSVLLSLSVFHRSLLPILIILLLLLYNLRKAQKKSSIQAAIGV